MNRIVITKAKEQALEFSKKLKNIGLNSLIFPMIGIRETTLKENFLRHLNQVCEGDLLIFVSKNSISNFFKIVKEQQVQLPKVIFLTVGKSSKTFLQNFTNEAVFYPENPGGKNLIKLDVLKNIENKNIFIFRGNGGDSSIINYCISKKAKLKIVECYERYRPEYNNEEKLEIINSSDAILITSQEILFNLISLYIDILPKIMNFKILVTSDNLYKLSSFLGFTHIEKIKSPYDDDILCHLRNINS